jgi:hypothetical protein
VYDDGSRDVLAGRAGQDWFFANLDGEGVRDCVTDFRRNDFATDLDFLDEPA